MKLGLEEIQLINALDSIARVSAKDCFVDKKTVVYLVPKNKLRQAIGKNGKTVQEMREKLRKNIELFEYSEKPEDFLKKAFHKAVIEEVEIKETKEKKIAIVKADAENKKLILRNLGRLNKIKELVKRNYSINEIRIR